MSFYKEHYDVVIIGGSLAGMAAALQLQSKGVSDILILERENLPGGQAAGYVRNGFDMEISLPGAMFVGTEKAPSKTRRFLHDMGIDVGWLPVPECFRVILPDFDVDVTLHADYERTAREINAAVPGTYDGVIGLLNLCRQVYDSMNVLSTAWPGKMQMILKHSNFLKTAGYSAAEVIASFHLPQKAIDILNPYWVYMGVSLNALPFTEYALWVAEYFADNRICRTSPLELALKMQKKAEANGAQFEFCQEVEKIFVKDGRVTGVRTSYGDEIHCDCVVSTPYPDKVYTQMIEPSSEIPPSAVKLVNSHKLSACPVSISIMIEGTPEENGIQNYFTFFSDTSEDDSEVNIDEIMAEDAQASTNQAAAPDASGRGCPTEYNCICAICPNYVNPKSVPEGYTRLSITALASAEAFENIPEESYQDLKRHLAKGLIDSYIQISGMDFRPWITKIDVATPVTFSRYMGTWKGGIYGYAPSMEHHMAARMQMNAQEHFIEGLAFTDIYGAPGDHLGVQIPEGMAAAQNILHDFEKRKEAASQAQKTNATPPEQKNEAAAPTQKIETANSAPQSDKAATTPPLNEAAVTRHGSAAAPQSDEAAVTPPLSSEAAVTRHGSAAAPQSDEAAVTPPLSNEAAVTRHGSAAAPQSGETAVTTPLSEAATTTPQSDEAAAAPQIMTAEPAQNSESTEPIRQNSAVHSAQKKNATHPVQKRNTSNQKHKKKAADSKRKKGAAQNGKQN